MLKASSTGQQGYGAGDTPRQRAKDESLVPKADLPKPVTRTDLNSMLGMKDNQDQSWINSRDVEPGPCMAQPKQRFLHAGIIISFFPLTHHNKSSASSSSNITKQ